MGIKILIREMKYSLLLVLSLVAVNYCVVEQPNLKYYHRYEKNHGQKINPNVPLHQHYKNERNLRKQADRIKDEIARAIQQAGFRIREVEHQIIAIKNEVNKARASRDAVVRMAEQRENSVKEEINHDEKFKELYQQRLKKNEARDKTALPDQRAALDKLIDFDEQRIAFWKKEEDRQQKILEHTTGRDIHEGVG